MLLTVNNLHTYYGNIHALHGISLNIDEGEIITLIGSNGAGKSTTLNSIMGLLHPREGEIIYNGKNIVGMPTYKIVNMGMSLCPEGREIFLGMTVELNLQLGAYIIRDEKLKEDNFERVIAIFPRLKERLKQVAGTLSGGEQQMLAIGRALMVNPKILMLDEPSLGLAPNLVETIFEVIQEINRQGVTILLIEQNARMALQIADRGYVLETGNIKMEGPADMIANDDKIISLYLGG